jgi:signal transduction histidine kinase
MLDGRPALLSRPAVTINLIGLALLTFGVISEAHLGLAGQHLATLLLLLVADGAWLAWSYTRYCEVGPAQMVAALTVMTLAGGALAAFAPVAVTYVGVASMGATIRWSPGRAAPIAVAGPLAALISLAGSGHDLEPVISVLATSLAGGVIGISRRESQLRTAQAASIEIAEARAQVLAARNHLARELHDVLAHTLSALSLQLQALEALVAGGRPLEPPVAEQLEQIKRLVRDGLDEARGAVQALREDVPALEDRLARLASERHAAIEVEGQPRDLPPDVALALYRVAQEALTNVMKHAPGATAAVRLDYSEKGVGISISNPSTPDRGSALAGTGGGYGIQGIKERVLLLGGSVEAGPTADGWLVSARVPV